jgi:hypothetical protein
MNASDFLQAGIDAMKDRAVQRDAPNGERSARRAANILTAWTGREWAEEDVWRCLMAVKMSREVQGRFTPDDITDGSAYFALLGETRHRLEVGQ